MSIKSDRWIKEMAINHEMIKPFELEQVRLGKNEEKLIKQEIEELEKSNALLSDNMDTDYIEILLRDKFLLGKKGETVYIIKNE